MQGLPDIFEHQPVGAALCGSIFAGLLAAALTQPADTIKTRMQGDVKKGKIFDYYFFFFFFSHFILI